MSCVSLCVCVFRCLCVYVSLCLCVSLPLCVYVPRSYCSNAGDALRKLELHARAAEAYQSALDCCAGADASVFTAEVVVWKIAYRMAQCWKRVGNFAAAAAAYRTVVELKCVSRAIAPL